MFKKIRIFILLFILFLVAANASLTHVRSTDWDMSLQVVLYPVNGDGSEASAAYINTLTPEDYRPVEKYISREAMQYGVELSTPVSIKLAPEIHFHPPEPAISGNILQVMLWSLKMRYWAWKYDSYQGPLVNVQIFIQYFDPEAYKELDHSLGLEKGKIGMVKAFAGRRHASRNNVIIAHEMLHTLGASDKYDPQTVMPLFPEGYAEPDLDPLLPQTYAEIMGGVIPLSAAESVMPDSLGHTVIGPLTAREINWAK